MNNYFGSPRARDLMTRYPLIDLHGHAILWNWLFGYDLTKRHDPTWRKRWGGRHADWPRYQHGLVGAQFQAMASLPIIGTLGCAQTVKGQIDALNRLTKEQSRLFRLAATADDFRGTAGESSVAMGIGIEGAHALQGNLWNLRCFADLGARYLTLLHFSANEVGFPSMGLGRDDSRGLTNFGREVIDLCERRGVIVDLAHLNDLGCRDAYLASTMPLMISHTGARAVYDHPRNASDEVLRWVAETGGVIGIIFAKLCLGERSLAAVVRHLNHMLQVVGEDHVAIGSDFDSVFDPPDDLHDVAQFPNLVDALLAAGWTEIQLAKLLRLNALRLLTDVPPKKM